MRIVTAFVMSFIAGALVGQAFIPSWRLDERGQQLDRENEVLQRAVRTKHYENLEAENLLLLRMVETLKAERAEMQQVLGGQAE